MFWKRASSNGALEAALISIPLSAFFKYRIPDMPFLHRMGTVFWICVIVQVLISIIESRGKDNPKAFQVDRYWFSTSFGFHMGALVVCGLLVLVYVVFW